MKKTLNLENYTYLIIFILPVYLLKINIFGLPTNLLEILIAIAFVWALILKLKFFNFLKPSFRIAIGAIFFGLLFSVIINKNYLAGAGIIKGWFILPILFALVVKNIIPTEKKENIYLTLYLSGFGVAIISLQNYLAGVVTFDGRLQGFFNSPNYLAMYLAPAIIIGIIKKESKLYRYPLGMILVAFYLTYSYAAWMAILASGIIVVWLKKKQIKISIKKISGILFIIIFLVSVQWNNQKLQDLKNVAERSSLQSRVMIWRSAKKIIADNWAFGIGPGNFQNKYLEYQKYFPPYLEWAVPHPHNVFLAFWLYGGLAGLVGFITLIFLWFREMAKKEKDMVRLMSYGVMLYFLLHGLVDTTYFKNDLAAVFWINLLILL